MNLTVAFAGDSDSQRDLVATTKLGHGRFEVFHAKGSSASEDYAIKVYPKNDPSKLRYLREKEFLASLDHPNVIKHYPVLQHNANCDILITEYANHGDFFDLVTKGGLAHEIHVRTYFQQLINGLEYLHAQGIAHLDLKLENLLLGKDFLLKIIDFDQAMLHAEEGVISAGTHSYRAPEIKERTCIDKFAADVFAAGVSLFALKTSQFPFLELEKDGQTKLVYYDLFMEDNEEFWNMKSQKMGKKSDFFTEDFKMLIRGMLERDPTKRMTLQEIKASEWYNKPTLSVEGLKFHMDRVCKRLAQE